MNFFHTFKYLEYKLTARHRKGFGIHSPFVFDLVSRVFRNKMPGNIVSNVESVRHSLIKSKRIINVNDLGAGGRRSKNRKVSEIAKNSAVPEKYGKLLSALAAEYGKTTILELGTSLGISTMYMAMSATDSRIITIEGCSETADIAEDNFKKAGLKNITVHTGSFDALLPQLIEKEKPGFIFLDGNHRKEPVIKYFEKIVNTADEKTVLVIDDIYLSAEMASAWNQIRHHPDVSVTVDIHRMGLVFFRQGITHYNYKIRY